MCCKGDPSTAALQGGAVPLRSITLLAPYARLECAMLDPVSLLILTPPEGGKWYLRARQSCHTPWTWGEEEGNTQGQ